MRKMLTILSLVLSSSAAFAQVNNCAPLGPNVECIKYLSSNTSLSKVESAVVCRGGVTVACIQFFNSNASLDKLRSAELCRTGVDLECVKYMRDNANLSYAESVKICKP